MVDSGPPQHSCLSQNLLPREPSLWQPVGNATSGGPECVLPHSWRLKGGSQLTRPVCPFKMYKDSCIPPSLRQSG